jgi:ATP-dependent HslUV protease subunit HslV
MTTIAWRFGLLAADGRVTDAGLIVTDQCKKITKLSDGSLFALCGDDLLEERLIEYLENCEDGPPPQGKDFTAILVETDGTVKVFNGSGDRFLPYPYQDFAAWGSGADFAYGAMEVGASAQLAVEAACRRNQFSGGSIQVEAPGHTEGD